MIKSRSRCVHELEKHDGSVKLSAGLTLVSVDEPTLVAKY